MSFPVALEGLTPREAIYDTVARALLGIDTSNRELFKSAFSADCSSTVFGNTSTGIQKMEENIFDNVAPMDTTHTMSGVRIHYRAGADQASFVATVLAQHGRPGKGHDPTAPRFLGGATYNIILVKEGADWKVKDWKIDLIWCQGDRSVMDWKSEA